MLWLRYVPAVLLVAVALNQLVLAHVAGLSAWAGGGFGMFSTTDAGATRHLHAFVLRPGIEREVDPPAELEHLTRQALTLPTTTTLRALALELAVLPSPDYGPATGVRVEIWQTHYDPDALAPASSILRALDVPLGAG